MLEGHEFGATGQVVGELFEADLVAGGVQLALPSRTGGAAIRKNTYTAAAPRNTPASGRANSRSTRGRCEVRPSDCFGPGVIDFADGQLESGEQVLA